MTVATARIYLGSSFHRDHHQKFAKKVRELLAQNPTVESVHFPFDQQFVDPAEDPNVAFGEERSQLWQRVTFQNDLNGIAMANCGVFLYDMDELDDGCVFEIGFMRAQHKPVILIPFTQHPEKKLVMNLMISQGVTSYFDGNKEVEELKTYDFNSCPSRVVTGFGTI